MGRHLVYLLNVFMVIMQAVHGSHPVISSHIFAVQSRNTRQVCNFLCLGLAAL